MKLILVVPGIVSKDLNCSKKQAHDLAVIWGREFGKKVSVYRPLPSYPQPGKLVFVVNPLDFV